MAKRTAYGLNEIRKLINIEEKELVTSQTNTAYDTNGVIVPISRIAQGLDYTNRVGDSIKMQQIEAKIRIYHNTTSGASVHRVALVRDLDGYGTLPNVSDIFETVGTTTAPLTQRDFLNRKRFAFVADWFFTTSTTDRSVVLELSKEHEGHILYLGTTAAASSDGKGSLYLVFISDESTNTPNFAFSTRIVFTDD